MKTVQLFSIKIFTAILMIIGCSEDASKSASQGAGSTESNIGLIDDARINNAESEPGNWLAYGRDYEEQRFSPLTQINRESVDRLGLAFELDLGSNDALEATPIVVDNTMFFTSTFSIVHAVDAKTGVEKWRYDPMVSKDFRRRLCCGPINRGVAVYQGKVYVGTVKRYTEDRAWGFVDCDLTYRIFGKDVFVHKRDLGGDIVPEMFKKHENSTHDDILFAPHKTPNFNLKEVRMKRGGEWHVIIENFRPGKYIMEALAGG